MFHNSPRSDSNQVQLGRFVFHLRPTWHDSVTLDGFSHVTHYASVCSACDNPCTCGLGCLWIVKITISVNISVFRNDNEFFFWIIKLHTSVVCLMWKTKAQTRSLGKKKKNKRLWLPAWLIKFFLHSHLASVTELIRCGDFKGVRLNYNRAHVYFVVYESCLVP